MSKNSELCQNCAISMNKENPINYRLKLQSVKIIDTLYLQKDFTNYKSAVEYFYNQTRKKHQQTGFRMVEFQKFYTSIRVFRSINNIDKINNPK